MPARARLSAQQRGIRRGGPSETRRVLYPIHEGPQTAFMTSQAEELLYGGAAGGGKSYGLRAWAVTYCMVYPGAKGVLFRQSFRQLDETHLIAIQQEVPEAIADYKSGTHDLIFHNGSILMFRFCEKDEDARTYDTAEFDFILFDELSHFTEFTYTYLTSRCRSTKPWWPGPRIRSGATPLGRGHSWVKSRFISARDTENQPITPLQIWKGPISEGGMTRQFIPAKVTDNPTLFQSDPTYMDRLQALPYEEYRAKALGDWDVFTGQFFRRWRDNIHVIEPFDIPLDWDHFLCVDYGDTKPYCALWFARPPNTQTAFVYREHYGKNVPLDEQVFRAWQASEDYGAKLKAVVLDPAMFGRVNVKGEYVKPMSEHWRAKFSTVVRGNNERIAGWRLMREMLDWQERPDGGVLVPPRLFFFRTCSNAVRTIPNLIIDKNNPEDVDTDGEDHAGDAIRYGIRHAFEGAGRIGGVRRVMVGPKGITLT